MLFSELGDGTDVRLNITIEETMFEFDTTVRTKHKKKVLLEPIRKNGKILNIQSDNIRVDVMYIREDEKPIIWTDTQMVCVKHKGQVYYAAAENLQGKEYNRRGDFRLFIGEEHPAKIGQNKRAHLVILKDLSSSGCAFVSAEKIKNPDGVFVYILYPGKIDNKTIELPLFGKIIRNTTLTDGRVLYGCVLVKKNEIIGHFINQKQMEQLAKKNERFSRE